MSLYKTGTVSVNNGQNTVTGNGTSFIDVANVQLGDLFTVDGSKLYEIYQVDSNTQIRIRNIVTGGNFAETTVTNGDYAIVRNFTSQTSAEIAAKVLAVQQKWQNREEEMTDWFYTSDNWADVTSINGDALTVMTPNGINNLLAPGAFGPDCSAYGVGGETVDIASDDFYDLPDTSGLYAVEGGTILNGPTVGGNFQVLSMSKASTVTDKIHYGAWLAINRDALQAYIGNINQGRTEPDRQRTAELYHSGNTNFDTFTLVNADTWVAFSRSSTSVHVRFQTPFTPASLSTISGTFDLIDPSTGSVLESGLTPNFGSESGNAIAVVNFNLSVTVTAGINYIIRATGGNTTATIKVND